MSNKPQFNREELTALIKKWMAAWNKHNLEGVMSLFHDNAEFIAWKGTKVKGKRAIKYAWAPWFANHNNFNFIIDQIIVDEYSQSVVITWVLDWLSQEAEFKGKKETRKGVDCLFFNEGLIVKKQTYCQTVVKIDQSLITLQEHKI